MTWIERNRWHIGSPGPGYAASIHIFRRVPMNMRLIALSATVVASLVAAALWLSVHSAWMQDRMFGPPSPLPINTEAETDGQRWILSVFDSRDQPGLEGRCTSNSYIVEYEIGGMFLDVDGEVIVDGNHLRSRTSTANANHTGRKVVEPATRILTYEQLFAIWNSIEALHAVPPPHHPLSEIDGYDVTFAICQAGSIWTTRVHDPEESSAAANASRVLHHYLVPDSATP